jgi:hypothetical protein
MNGDQWPVVKSGITMHFQTLLRNKIMLADMHLNLNSGILAHKRIIYRKKSAVVSVVIC